MATKPTARKSKTITPRPVKNLPEWEEPFLKNGLLTKVIKDGVKQLIWSPNAFPSPTSREILEKSEWKRVQAFIDQTRKGGAQYPIPGLALSFQSENGKIRMLLEVKDKPSFGEAVEKHWPLLSHWRQRLTAFEERPTWEFLPHPVQILIARSKKGRDCFDWMKTHDPTLWKIANKDRGNGLSPGQLSKELNQNIKAWLDDFNKLNKGSRFAIGFNNAVDVLMAIGFSKKREDAVAECQELLAGIRDGKNLFNAGRAEYCKPITTEMIRKRIDAWTA